jgi:hypothetical protein
MNSSSGGLEMNEIYELLGLCRSKLTQLIERFTWGEQRDEFGDLPPHSRAIFDNMIRLKPANSSADCAMCGGTKSGADGHICRTCIEFGIQNKDKSIHGCDGCGAGFLVSIRTNIYTFEENGLKRILCACCQDYLAETSEDSRAMLPIPIGYDDEGRELNLTDADESPARKLFRRRNQARLRKGLELRRKRLKEGPPPALLFASMISEESKRQKEWRQYLSCLSRDDIQALTTILAFAWKHGNMKPATAVEYALQTVFLSRHGTPEEVEMSNETRQSAIKWSIDRAPDSMTWQFEALAHLKAWQMKNKEVNEEETEKGLAH